MAVRLRTESLDDAPDEREFPDIEAAIEYAVGWFEGGYEDHDEHTLWSVANEAKRIGPCLRDGGVFRCSMFYEKIELLPDR